MVNIEISLNNRNSIKEAIKTLNDYNRDLEKKTKLLLEKLADKGIKVAFEKAKGDTHHFDGMVTFEKKYENGVLQLVGRNSNTSGLITHWYDSEGGEHSETISPILALEYGTAGLAIEGHSGTFATTGNATNLISWVYYEDIDEKGRPIHSHWATAEEPHRPMYEAWLEMKREIKSTAREVFGTK